ncbi:predicted protein [Naegleria gruberi]|uniref:Predicted protein n=1 Tax=Naegleria gruberi TaxID=5762 RepID=D2VG16_NAEGR|nr:uncharacterized protein NAEGRDRAFT_67820 [Naegleria gruberi]EFC44186.1 predicted protein [Naegleria gruberi]|eukprot:XP_002676930.1 predicted protein [Naegleria gruberi strain NEG-M]
MLYYRMKEFNGAFDDFTRAIQLNPNDPIHYYNRGNISRRRGNYSEALKDYDRALELNANFSQVLTMRGATYFEIEEFEKAIADCERSIALDPSDNCNLLVRGKSYFKSGNLIAAFADLMDYLKTEQNNSDALSYLVKLYKIMKQFDTAYEFLLHIGEIEGLSFENVYERAECLEEMKNYPLAIKHWTAIMDNEPQNPRIMEILLRRGQCYMENKEFSNAIKDFQSVIESTSSENELKESAKQLIQACEQ